MDSIEVQRTLKLAGRIIVPALVLVSRATFSQPVFDSAAERQRRIVESIEQEQSRNGPHAEGLIAPLTALVLLYQEEGDLDPAAATIEQVLQLIRVTYGLHSLEQAPLIRQLIANEEAIGNVETAWSLEQEVLALARRHPDDLRTVSMLREAADRRMAILGEYLAGGFPPQIVLGCYYDWPRRESPSRWGEPPAAGWEAGDCGTGGIKRHAVQALVADAQRSYAEAAAVILRNGLYASDELRELELELVRSSNVFREHAGRLRTLDARLTGLDHASLLSEPWRSWNEALTALSDWSIPSLHDAETGDQNRPGEAEGQRLMGSQYAIGRAALQRLFEYEVATSAPWQRQAAALVRIADWDLLNLQQKNVALRSYEYVYQRLRDRNVGQASIDEIFSPEVPVVLPGFEPNPLVSKEMGQSTGYIDVAFEITRYGESRRVEVRGSTANVTEASKEGLVDLIRRSQFRPRLTDGRFARASPVVVRYFLSD